MPERICLMLTPEQTAIVKATVPLLETGERR
jgi:hemoglobin-like flavoprotein